jgi:hypothetical protein
MAARFDDRISIKRRSQRKERIMATTQAGTRELMPSGGGGQAPTVQVTLGELPGG